MQRIALAAALVFACGSALAQNVAVVNGKAIPKSAEDAWVKELGRQGQKDSPEMRKFVKDQLIQREILMQEASKRGIPNKPEVKFQLDVQRQATMIQAMMRDEMEKKPITDAEIKTAYDTQKAQVGSKEYRARHILVEKEDEAKAIIDQIKKGAKFEEIAKKSSKDTGSAQNGGELDWAAPDAYVKPFSEAMAGLKKGEMTQVPVKSQFGYHVIKLEDSRDTQFPALDQVKPQIVEALQQQKVQAFVQKLTKDAKVQ
ncbi:MAG: peptidylprolyl isomerase [Burkholderiaceae bacterium]